MPKLITASTFILFWVFYEMSGGADFEPRERVIVTNAPFLKPDERQPVYVRPATAPMVTNASFTTVETTPAPAAPVAAEPVVVAAPAPEAPEAVATPTLTLVYVAGDRVNLRRGPGTDHPVVDTLTKGTEAELIASNDIGWARIRLTGTDQEGWMAESLLSDG